MESKIVNKNGDLLIGINGETFAPSAYMTYIAPQGDFEAFKKAGFRLFFGCVRMGESALGDHVWKSENEYDFSSVKEVLDEIIGSSAIGEIYIILRINLNVPQWWMDKYPDEVMQDENGKKWVQSPASGKWRRDSAEFLRRLRDYIADNGYEEYVAGWHLAALATEEWYIPEAGSTVYDFSPVNERAFGEFCRRKYKDIGVLNQTYRKDLASFDEVRVPTCSERYRFSLNDRYRELSRDAVGKDYFEFCGELVSDAIVSLARAAKALVRNKMLVGVFYGYVNVLPAWRGHASLAKVLACEAVDFLASPLNYVNLRKGAFDWNYNGATDSARHAGKLWFMEADVRTWLTRPLPESYPQGMEGKDDAYKKRYYEPVWYGPETEERSKWHLTRAFGKILCSKNAYWWFDMWGGWYRSEGLIAHIAELEKLYRKAMSQGRRGNSDIAVIVDERMSLYTGVDNFVTFIESQFPEFGFIGAPYDIYLLGDLGKVDFSGYKTCVFVAALDINDKQLAEIEKLKTGGRSLMFSGPAGMNGGNGEKLFGPMRFDTSGKTAKRSFGDHTIFLNAVRKFSAEEIRNATREAGGHIYSDAGDIVYADEDHIVLTAVFDGKHRLSLPDGKRVKAVIGGKGFVAEKDRAELEMQTEESVIFELERI